MTETAERCAQCAAPLVGDQRYCLSCGSRRGEARLPFREILAAPVPAVAAGGGALLPLATAGATAVPAVDRARANLTLVAGLGCLLLALGVGILIGKAGQGTARPAAPQVISVGAGAPAASPTPAAGASGAGNPTNSAGSKKPKSAGAAKSAKSSKATNKVATDLQNASPQDYQKKSAKLPKTVVSGGKAPPVDKSKPAGAGTSFQEIG
jgi:hypothetical protein